MYAPACSLLASNYTRCARVREVSPAAAPATPRRARASERAHTQRSQLVAKVRASPNNGFPHEEQIGGTIYLSGALANVCILTREPPRIFNSRAHRCARAPSRHSRTRSRVRRGRIAWDAPISMRGEKKRRAASKSHLITPVGHAASILRPDSEEFFHSRQIRATRSTGRVCTIVSRDSIGIVAPRSRSPIEIEAAIPPRPLPFSVYPPLFIAADRLPATPATCKSSSATPNSLSSEFRLHSVRISPEVSRKRETVASFRGKRRRRGGNYF